jgi:small ligand-binding sensory domain FIST
MKWASAAGADTDLVAAIATAADEIEADLNSDPDLLVVFLSAHYASGFDRVPEILAARFGAGLIVGCSAGGVIGGAREIEQRPGVSLTAACLPDVTLTPFHLESDALPALAAPTAEWQRALRLGDGTLPHFLLVPDPFSFDAESCLLGLDRAFPRSQKIGGLASGGRQPGGNALFLGTQVYRTGAVGVAFTGNIEVDTIVAQGCRPIGEPMFVTRCQKNILWELDGESPLKILQDLYERSDPRDQELARHSLFLGIVMQENRHEYHQGDFLIRNIIGMDAKTGAVAIGAMLSEGAVVQFHLRDAKTSTADLEELLSRYAANRPREVQPCGSLLFSCLGRGMHLYGRADQDTDTFRRYLGDVPLGGFFCNGEIGPVHGSTFLHGYTSSFGLFRPRVG